MKAQPLLLEVNDLSVEFRSKSYIVTAIESVSLNVYEGQAVGIVGESGSGKSVTSLAIMGLIRAPGTIRSGTVRLSGRDLLNLSEPQRRQYLGKHISMIFQEPTESLNPVLMIGTQIEEVLKIHTDLNRGQRQLRLLELMNVVGLPDPQKTLRARPHQLSGGMNQRVMIAMAIACNPTLLIADEPTTALDVTVQKQVLELLHSLQRANNMGMIFISHDLSVVSMIADKILVMYAGQVVECCDTEELFQHPAHPYTEALLKSLPENFQKTERRMASIAGAQPALDGKLPGCKFQPRCSYAREQCKNRMPEMNILNTHTAHSVRCFYPLTAKNKQAGR